MNLQMIKHDSFDTFERDSSVYITDKVDMK